MASYRAKAVHLSSDSDQLRALLGFGEVSSSTIARLESIAHDIVGPSVRVMNSIDHTIVAAEGSARVALHTQLHPDEYMVFGHALFPEHDEL